MKDVEGNKGGLSYAETELRKALSRLELSDTTEEDIERVLTQLGKIEEKLEQVIE